MSLLVRASAPKFRRGRAGALTSRRDRRKYSGKSLEILFATAWVPYRPRQQRSPSSLLPHCLCNSLPRRLWPTRCCSMRSSPANHDAPVGTPQAPIGCEDRLCLSPLRLPSPPGPCGARRRKPPFRVKRPRKQEPESPCHFSGGKPLFYSLAFPLPSSRSPSLCPSLV